MILTHFNNFDLNVCNNKKWIIFAAQIVRWCNGSTADFDSACSGSSPGRTTRYR